ncbi:MAG: cobalamin-dependent protein [Verrucomicrobiota bacterium]
MGQRAAMAALLVDREFARHLELEVRYGRSGRERCLEDACYHLSYLAEAVATGNPGLFADYLGWAKVMLAQRRIPAGDLVAHLQSMREVLGEILPAELSPPALEALDHGLKRFPDFPEELPSLIEPGQPHSLLAHQYLQALLCGERHVGSRLVLDAVERGVGVREIYLYVFQRTQYEIGRLWQTNTINVAQEHYCTAATQLIMSQLYPHIFSGTRSGGMFVGTCVQGDLHEIGMRMVADFFEMSGWNTCFLGANTPTPGVVQMVVDRTADVLGISATIAYHVRAVEDLVGKVRAEPACAGVKILVGGYPFNRSPDLWRTVGADGSACDAGAVVDLAEQLTAGGGP